jgi:uncharacterized protein (TIGR03437 family)
VSRPTFITLSLSFTLTVLAGSAFGQSNPAQGKLPAIFHGALSSRLAAADTVAVSITQGGVVPIYSSATTIQPSSWISIYGTNLAPSALSWNNDFPTSLNNTTVLIDNKPAYLLFVSPGVIDAQAPDDAARGSVMVQVNTVGGSAASTVTIGDVGPSFSVLGAKYVAGVISRSDGSGTQGGGTYDFLGPKGNSLGFVTVPAKAGDVVALYGVGFGPTTTSPPAGAPLPAGPAAIATDPIQVLINGVAINAPAALSEAGLFQLNVTIPPGLGTGDVPIIAMVNGVQTPTGIFISLQ